MEEKELPATIIQPKYEKHIATLALMTIILILTAYSSRNFFIAIGLFFISFQLFSHWVKSNTKERDYAISQIYLLAKESNKHMKRMKFTWKDLNLRLASQTEEEYLSLLTELCMKGIIGLSTPSIESNKKDASIRIVSYHPFSQKFFREDDGELLSVDKIFVTFHKDSMHMLKAGYNLLEDENMENNQPTEE